MGPFDFFLDTTEESHHPSCHIALAIGANRDRKVGLRYTGLRGLLSTAVQLSFIWTSGAGGFSFGPNFSYYPTVDETKAPVFQVLYLLQRYSNNLTPRRIMDGDFVATLTDFETLIALGVKKIGRLFQTRKASPLAVNSRNESLAHHVAEAVNFL